MKLRGGALRLYELVKSGGRVEIRKKYGEEISATATTPDGGRTYSVRLRHARKALRAIRAEEEAAKNGAIVRT